MEKNEILLATAAASAILIAYNIYKNMGLEYVRSTIDNELYKVQSKDDKQAAADTLAIIKIKLKKMANHLLINFPSSNSTKKLKNNYNDFKYISENNDMRYHTSYTVNKGEQMVFCIRQTNDSLVPMNDLTFVALHEMAHVCSSSRDHTPEFWTNFSFLLQEAIKLQIWEYIDYDKRPVDYCGIMITDTPNV
jgi:predicted metal-dependent hydrolase